MNLIPLSEQAILEVSGRDAITFLQGYCTCDLDALFEGNACYGAITNLQGRVETTFVAKLDQSHELTSGDQTTPSILLRMARSAVPHISAFLSKYIVFSKATLADRSEDIACYASFEPLEDTQGLVIEVSQRPQGFELWTTTGLPCDGDLLRWQQADLDAHLIWLAAHQAGEFQPFELGMTQNGGVNFKKGCYLGQEIIARVHYRGQPKTQLVLAIAAEGIQEGELITDETDSPCGKVITSVPTVSQTALAAVLNVNAINSSIFVRQSPLIIQDRFVG